MVKRVELPGSPKGGKDLTLQVLAFPPVERSLVITKRMTVLMDLEPSTERSDTTPPSRSTPLHGSAAAANRKPPCLLGGEVLSRYLMDGATLDDGIEAARRTG